MTEISLAGVLTCSDAETGTRVCLDANMSVVAIEWVWRIKFHLTVAF